MKKIDALNWVNNYAKPDSFANQILKQSVYDGGMHTSRSGSDHLTLKNQFGQVTGHVFQDGQMQGYTDTLDWMKKK